MRFIKEDERWYVDLPDWTGEKEELEMVAGADTLCDILAQGDNSVNVRVELEPFEGAYELLKLQETPDIGGALYNVSGNNVSNFDIWLCAVTEFVFGNLPQTIYIK